MADKITTVVDHERPCDFHHLRGERVLAEYDGKTKSGPWAWMCEECFQERGIGLGLGRGQKLILKDGGGRL